MSLTKAARPAPVAPSVQEPAAPPAVRASDADRDRVADILREALAEGRLDAEEHAERVETAFQAKTLAELEPLISDLPAGQRRAASRGPAHGPAAGSRPARGREPGRHGVTVHGGKDVVAVFSGASRQGRLRVGAKMNVVAVFGGVDVDLTEAIFEQQHVVINATAICGGIEIKVPENVSLRGAGTGIMGGFDVRESESGDPDAPVVVIQGVAIWGGVEARPVAGKRIENLSD
ncbi:DUF1707 SHOCT-like domain-containing protein [Streptomyces sp. 4N509B]|uniref:DUF1707 SHOCT-like domain-containing protein n=1 Tax=Streptomyces sp. 4N509B TaxID=3457413 RepID=UPI003FD68D83